MSLHRWQLRKNVLYISAFLLFLLGYVGIYNYYYQDLIACYRIKGESLPKITQIPNGRSLFFHETSCNSFLEGKIVIKSRQACAVESAARTNPNSNVYLLYTSPGIFKFNGTESDNMLKALLTYNNVNILHLDYEEYTKGTPLESFFADRIVESSQFALSHASDVLRYLTLWKFGGIYLDLDVVVIKSLEDLPRNFAGAESDKHVAAGILGFEGKGFGHELATRCVMDLKEHFSRTAWGYNGPGVITRLLQNLCNSETAKQMFNKDCQGMKVFPPESFYPIPWWNWTIYFNSSYKGDIWHLTENSYFVHVWNLHSVNTAIPIDSQVPYTILAKKYCPKVFAAINQFF